MRVGHAVPLAVLAPALVFAISCGDPVQSNLLAPSKSADSWVPGGTLNAVIVRQPPAVETGNVYNTLAAALSHVPPGGVIRMADGRHFVSEAIVTIPVTIEPLAGAHPILDAQQAYSAIEIQAAGPIAVTISGLEFENASGHTLQVKGTPGRVVIDESEFSGSSSPGGCCNADVFFYQASGGPGVVVNDRFLGGDIGVGSHEFAGDLIIAGNSFSGQNYGAIHTGGGGPIEGRVVIAGNRISSCGVTCVGDFGPGTKDVRFNLITDDASAPTQSGLWLAGQATIEFNRIVGAPTPGDPAGPFSISLGAINAFGATVSASHNYIRNAATAFWLDHSTVQAHDELIDHVIGPFGGWGPPTENRIALRESNITNYSTADGVFYGVYSYVAADLRCNWWGSPSGPVNTDATLLTQYSPWATAPVSNTGRTC